MNNKIDYIMDNLPKRNTDHTMFLLNVQKLLLIDSETMKELISKQHELVSKVPRNLLLFHFLQRTERELPTEAKSFVMKKDTRFSMATKDYFGVPEKTDLGNISMAF